MFNNCDVALHLKLYKTNSIRSSLFAPTLKQCTNWGFHFHCKYFRFLSLSAVPYRCEVETFYQIYTHSIWHHKSLRKKKLKPAPTNSKKKRKKNRKITTMMFVHASLDCSKVFPLFFSHDRRGRK